jgi:anaerobic selenocysteine-containing dehydrogenase
LRLGQEQYWPWNDIDEAYNYRLSPLGYTIDELVAQKGGSASVPGTYQKYTTTGFGTPTGKVELYSTILEKLGSDPLPWHEEAPESQFHSPELAERYPYVLITGGRILQFYHSQQRQVEPIRRKHPQPLLQINPATAAKLGIEDGDWVWIETPNGRVRQKCKYFAGINPRVVHAEHGWWFPEEPGEEPWLHGLWESNINVVADDSPQSCDKLSGGWQLRGGLCNIYKAKSY